MLNLSAGDYFCYWASRPVKAEFGGRKKYSPPCAVTNWTVIDMLAEGFAGSMPVIQRFGLLESGIPIYKASLSVTRCT